MIIPNEHGIAVLILTVIALVLFAQDKIPLETSCLVVLIALVSGFQFFPYLLSDGVLLNPIVFFAGFGNEALITICALMIVGKGIEVTGALNPLASQLTNAWSSRPLIALILTLFVAAILSAFMNNTPIVVLLLPILVSVSLRVKFPVSRIMMPMGFATIIGGMSTTIGTSTNLLIVGIAQDLNVHNFSMFDFMLPVTIIGGIALIFLSVIAPKFLPDRIPPMSDTSPRLFSAQLYVGDNSFAANCSLSEVLEKTNNEMRIEKIQRGEDLFLAKFPEVKLLPGDRLFVQDSVENLKHYEQELGATLYNVADNEHPVDSTNPLVAEGQQLAEVVVTRGSPLHLKSLSSIRFSSSFGLIPLAIHRARSTTSDTKKDLHSIRLRAGDVLLIQGSSDSIENLKNNESMLVLDGAKQLPHTHKAKRAITIISLVILAAAFGIMPISISSIIGVGMMLVLGCLTWSDAFKALSARVIMIVVVSLALGKALIVTGMVNYLADLFVLSVSNFSIPIMLSALMLIMSILTNIVSNNAAAVIGAPIAVSVAQQLNIDPEPFILAVLFGANMSFATPFSYKTNLLIFSAGGYKFSDFLRIGIPLTIIMWLGFSLLLPTLYSLWG